MNIRPPIVGVPCFVMCHEGPISLIICPAFILRRNGTIKSPATAETANATANAIIKLTVICIPPIKKAPYFFEC